MATQLFDTVGQHSFDVPGANDTIIVRLWGPEGGQASASGDVTATGQPGLGGYAEGELVVTTAEALALVVGGQGQGASGGSAGDADGGDSGGATDVRQGGTTLSDRVAVVGGGGGPGAGAADESGDDSGNVDAGDGGHGAGSSGGATDGEDAANEQATGGDGGASGSASGESGSGVSDSGGPSAGAGGAGGGGADGGGGGNGYAEFAGAIDTAYGHGGGGGGGDGDTSGLDIVTDTQAGVQTGDGKIEIVYNAPPSNLTATAQDGDTIDLSWALDVNDWEDGVRVKRAEASGSVSSDYTEIADLPAGTESYTDTGREDGERYYYRIEAYSSAAGSNLSDEAAATAAVPQHSVADVERVSSTELTVHWDRVDDSPDGGWDVERSTDQGSTWTTAASGLSPSTTSYADAGLSSDARIDYRITRSTDHASVQATAYGGTVAAPSSFAASIVNGDDVDASWDDNSGAEESYRVEASRDGGSTWSDLSASLAADATSYSHSDLLDGEAYDLRAVAVLGLTEAASGTDSVTTTLPDVAQPTLSTGASDEVIVGWVDVIDYGAYWAQIRQTGESAWDSSAAGYQQSIADEATTQTTFSGLANGTEYEVRVRSGTEHADGAWTSPAAITTTGLAPSGLTVDATSTTSADLSWTDESDDETGYRVDRRTDHDGEWGPWRVVNVDDLPANTTSYQDDTAQPNRTYQYRVCAFTADSEECTDPVEAQTGETDVRQTNIRARGAFVEVDHASGVTREPEILADSLDFRPTINGRPEVDVPVPKADYWTDSEFESAAVRVWQDGQRLPIDELHAVEQRPDRTVLKCRGGRELDTRVSVEYDDAEAHATAESLIQDETGYVASVDDPAQGTATEELMLDLDSIGESDLEIAPTPSDPWEVSNGALRMLPTCWPREAESADRNVGTDVKEFFSGDQFGLAIELQHSGDEATWQITTEHDIPAGELGLPVRVHTPDTADLPTVEWSFGGEVLGSGAVGTTPTPNWYDIASLFASNSATIPAGTHELAALVTDGGNDTFYLDVVAPQDTGSRFPFGPFNYSFDNTVDAGERIASPGRFPPDGITIPFVETATPRAVVGGRATASLNSTTGPQSIALSNDGGTTWQTATNADSIDTTFGSAGGSLKFRATLGGYGSDPNNTPTDDFDGQTLSGVEAYATVEDTPVLVDFVEDGSLEDVLNAIAAQGNFIWELQWDRLAGTMRVEWTRRGQRTADADPDVVDYQTRKENTRYKSVTIYGSAQQVSNERITADHGSAQQVTDQQILQGSVAFYPTGGGANYERGTDYVVDNQAGEITTLASGSMTDGTGYGLDFRERPAATESTGGFVDGEDRELVETIPSASSNRECAQAALYLLERVSEPRYSASVTVSRLDAGTSLVDDLNIEGLPGDIRYIPESIVETAEQLQLEGGTRQRVGDYLSTLSTRLSTTERQV